MYKFDLVKIGEKFYITRVKHVMLLHKEDDKYLIACRVMQYGQKWGLYNKDTDYIEKDDKKYYLTADVKYYIDQEVKKFDDQMNAILTSASCHHIVYKEIEKEDYIVYKGNGEYACVSKYIEFGKVKTRIYEERSGINLVVATKSSYDINDNPLYIYSTNNNDKYLEYLIEYLYGYNTKESLAYLKNEDGVTRIGSIDKKFNKEYYVISNTIDVGMLIESGYLVMHRPYFAMKGSTHDIYTLNPYTRSGVDAAPIGVTGITFEEYIRMVNENE